MRSSLRGSCRHFSGRIFFGPGVRYRAPKLSAPDPGSKSAAIGYRAAPTHPFLTAFMLPCPVSKRRQHYGTRLVPVANLSASIALGE